MAILRLVDRDRMGTVRDSGAGWRLAVAAAAAAGARPVLVLTGKGQKTHAHGNLPEHTQVFPDLAAFAEHLAP